MTGESLSPRTSKPIFLSSDLKKLLFSRMRASFWAPASNTSQAKTERIIQYNIIVAGHIYIYSRERKGRGTSAGAILPKDNSNSRDDLLHCRRRHGGSVQMARTGVLQVLDYLLKDGSQTERKRYDSTRIATCMLCFFQ